MEASSSSGAALVAEAEGCLGRGALPDACKLLERAFAAFASQGEPRQAAATAARLVNLYEVVGAEAAGRGWEQRGLSVLPGTAPFVGPDQAAFEAMLNPLLHAVAA